MTLIIKKLHFYEISVTFLAKKMGVYCDVLIGFPHHSDGFKPIAIDKNHFVTSGPTLHLNTTIRTMSNLAIKNNQ